MNAPEKTVFGVRWRWLLILAVVALAGLGFVVLRSSPVNPAPETPALGHDVSADDPAVPSRAEPARPVDSPAQRAQGAALRPREPAQPGSNPAEPGRFAPPPAAGTARSERGRAPGVGGELQADRPAAVPAAPRGMAGSTWAPAETRRPGRATPGAAERRAVPADLARGLRAPGDDSTVIPAPGRLAQAASRPAAAPAADPEQEPVADPEQDPAAEEKPDPFRRCGTDGICYTLVIGPAAASALQGLPTLVDDFERYRGGEAVPPDTYATVRGDSFTHARFVSYRSSIASAQVDRAQHTLPHVIVRGSRLIGRAHIESSAGSGRLAGYDSIEARFSTPVIAVLVETRPLADAMLIEVWSLDAQAPVLFLIPPGVGPRFAIKVTGQDVFPSIALLRLSPPVILPGAKLDTRRWVLMSLAFGSW